ncbi:MAG: N-acetylmuramoyl-L-alanine amidase [Pseudomonadota bacterium]
MLIALLKAAVWAMLWQDVSFAAQESSEPAVAFAGRLVGDETRLRLIMDFDKRIEHTSYLLANPARFIVDVPTTVFALGSVHLPKASFASDMKYGSISTDRSRIVLALSSPVKIERATVSRLQGRKHYRLIIDLVKTDEQTFRAAVLKEPRPVKRRAAKRSNPKAVNGKSDMVVVLDPGHGGRDGGAIGQGKTAEKDIVLRFAKRLKARLEKDKRFTVLLTRNNDRYITLSRRVAFARRHRADLLLSIHADALRQRFVRGATVYTLSQRGADQIARSLSQNANRLQMLENLELDSEPDRVSNILLELTKRETRTFAKRFAGLLIDRYRGDIRLLKKPHRAANFFVLKAPEIPSVLLELGYLSNRKDEKMLNDPKWTRMAVDRTAKAIHAFFAPRFAVGH